MSRHHIQPPVVYTPAPPKPKETRRRREAWLTARLSTMTPDDRAVLARAARLLEEIAAS